MVDVGSDKWLAKQLSVGESCLEKAYCVLDDGRQIHYLRWRRKPLNVKNWDVIPATLLVHGAAANAYWYGYFAPLLFNEAKGFDIIAISNSGNGDSSNLNSYSVSDWADETLNVARTLKLFRAAKPKVVAHSFGCFIATYMFLRSGDLFSGLVLIDCPISEFDVDVKVGPTPNGEQLRFKPHIHKTTTPGERFRLMPDQPIKHPALVKHVAEQSSVKVLQGFHWKGDPDRDLKMIHTKHPLITGEKLLNINKTKCKVGYIYGTETAIVKSKAGNFIPYVYKSLSPYIPVIPIESAGHHVWLDKPVECAAAVILLFEKFDDTHLAFSSL